MALPILMMMMPMLQQTMVAMLMVLMAVAAGPMRWRVVHVCEPR